MNTKLIIVALAGFAVGGTCPSDVNNDGTVGIQVFLQVLGDWGPCPSPPVVTAMATDNTAIPGQIVLVRQWSDGLTQVGGFAHNDFTDVDLTVWADAPPSKHKGQVVSVSSHKPTDVPTTCFCGGNWNRLFRAYRQFADGYLEVIDGNLCIIGGFDELCISFVSDWHQVGDL